MHFCCLNLISLMRKTLNYINWKSRNFKPKKKLSKQNTIYISINKMESGFARLVVASNPVHSTIM
jgi:hypothetical protein